MSILFDDKKCVEQLVIRNTLDENKKIKENIQEELRNLELQKVASENSIEEYEKRLKKLRGIKNILFNRKKSKQDKINFENNIGEETSKISNCTQRITELKEKMELINNEIDFYEKEYTSNYAKELTIEDGVLTISDQNYSVNVPIDESKRVLVHCTDYFPKNKTILCNYDGNKPLKKVIEYEGVNKVVNTISHRHTCHFTQNEVVRSTGDGVGTWEQPKYIIIEPYELHKEQLIHDDSSDSWTYGSVKLGDKPLLLVRSDEYKNLKKQDFEDYSIIKYDGRYDKCVINILHLLGVKLDKTDSRNASHSNSVEDYVETSLDYRHFLTNYIKNDEWDGKSEIIISEKELFELYELSKSKKDYYYKSYKAINNILLDRDIEKIIDNYSDDIPLYDKFIKFIINFGIIPKESNYTFKPDNEIYEEMAELSKKKGTEEAYKYLEKTNDFKLVKELFDNYLSYLNNKKQNPVEVEKDFLLMSCQEAFEFEKIENSKKIFDYLKEKGLINAEREFALTKNGCEIKITKLIENDVLEKLLNQDFNISTLSIMNGKYVSIKKCIEAETIIDLISKIDSFYKRIDIIINPPTKLEEKNQKLL